MGSYYPPLSISALFYGFLKLLKATQKGKKSKEGFVLTPGNELRTSRAEGSELTSCANPSSLTGYVKRQEKLLPTHAKAAEEEM